MRPEMQDLRLVPSDAPQRTHGLRRNTLAMLLALGTVQANAYRDSDVLFSSIAVLGGSLTITLVASGGTDQFAPIASMLGAVALIGGAATTSDISKNGMGHWHKLMVQAKMDHDTYLAGGEMTPFLQALYREIAVRKSVLAPEGKVDEERLTEAIDRMMAMTEGSAP